MRAKVLPSFEKAARTFAGLEAILKVLLWMVPVLVLTRATAKLFPLSPGHLFFF